MFVPLFLITLAALSTGVVAYGSNAFWAQYPHGIELILWSRRLQWPLVAFALLLCLWLLGLVISGKRRAWWLIGLGPILALFAHHFLTDPSAVYSVVENPTFVTAGEASFVNDEDYVVGLRFGDSTYAYPYSVLYYNPVVIQSDHDRRMLLMWSAFASRAVAQSLGRDLKARDLEIVSMPANALLVYNRANGQFINGVTGQTMRGEKPAGFAAPVVLSTMSWRDWRTLNPQTKVMESPAKARSAAPRGPVLPAYPMPPMRLDVPAGTSIVVVGTSEPAALRADNVGREPIHVTVDGEPAFVFRDPAGVVHAFSCHLKKQEIFTRFRLDTEHRYKGAMFVDTDTGSGWSASGVWVDGIRDLRPEFRGSRLTALPVQEGLSWGVMKFWYPHLKLLTPRKSEGQSVTSAT